MSPTPPSHSSFTDNFRFRSRRQRHTIPYDPTANTTPTQTHAPPPVTPLVDEDNADGGRTRDVVSDVEDEDIEEDVEGDLDDDQHDAEEEEGGIEEGLFHTSIHYLPATSFPKFWRALPASFSSYTPICLLRARWTWCKANPGSIHGIVFRDQSPALDLITKLNGLHNSRVLLIDLNHQYPWILIPPLARPS